MVRPGGKVPSWMYRACTIMLIHSPKCASVIFMGTTWEEKGSNVSTFWVCITKPSWLVLCSSSQSFPTFTGAILLTARRCAALAFAHGIAKVSISASLITFVTRPMVGVPKMMGTLNHKIGKVWDDQGYLIFVITPNSIHLNPDYYITKQFSVGIA